MLPLSSAANPRCIACRDAAGSRGASFASSRRARDEARGLGATAALVGRGGGGAGGVGRAGGGISTIGGGGAGSGWIVGGDGVEPDGDGSCTTTVGSRTMK